MKRISANIGSDPIEKLAGLLNNIYKSSTIDNNELKIALFEIGECLKILRNDINELKTRK